MLRRRAIDIAVRRALGLGVVSLSVGIPAAMADRISISKLGSGIGLVSSEDEELYCGDSCIYDWSAGESIMLNITNDEPFGFIGWSVGLCEGAGPHCSFTTEGTDQTIAAYFGGPDVAAGGYHTLALNHKGEVWAFGENSTGQLGDGTMETRSTPVKVAGFSEGDRIDAIAAGYRYSLALKSDGTLWAWGENTKGQLGDNTLVDRPMPVQVDGLNGIITMGAGHQHTAVLTGSGEVWTWGDNSKGQLGNGSSAGGRKAPGMIESLTGIIAIAAGDFHTIALKNDGTVWAWGSNLKGQLGDGTNKQRATPVKVKKLRGIVAVKAGVNHSLALGDDGKVYTFGENSDGQLGDGSRINRNVPVLISAASGTRKLSAGASHSAVLKQDGTLWVWGKNNEGQLGNGTFTKSNPSPKQVKGDLESGVINLVAGASHTVVLKEDGSVWAFGADTYGQLGNGEPLERSSEPRSVSGLNIIDELIYVTATAGANGSITPASQGVEEGEKVTFTVTPDKGYKISKVVGCGSGKLSGSTYTTASITEACDVKATFAKATGGTYKITLTTTGSGYGIVKGGGSYAEGKKVRLTAIPEEGSSFVRWTPSPCATSFIMPGKNLTCTAEFVSDDVDVVIE